MYNKICLLIYLLGSVEVSLHEKFILLKNKLKEAFLDNATPSVLSFSAAIGLFWNFIPSLGIGPLAAYFTAKFFKGKGAIAVSINIATGCFIPILYALNIFTGKLVSGRNLSILEIEEQMGKTLEMTADYYDKVVQEPTKYFFIDRLQNFTVDFFAGAIINGIFFSFIFYLLVYLFLKFGNIKRRKAH